MPREELTIDTFNTGIVTTVDAQDTPISAASWSVDQDPEVPEGILRGREDDEVFIDSGGITDNDYNGSFVSWIVREDGKRDFICYSKSTGKLHSINDFFAASPDNRYTNHATLTANMQVSIEPNNRSVRFASGNNAVKYLGYIDHAQFSGSINTSLQYVDATLNNIPSFPSFYKTVGNTTYQYGVEYNGKKLYKITVADGTLAVATQDFNEIRSIAFDGTYIWLFDAKASTYGTLYKIDSSLNRIAFYICAGFGAASRGFGFITQQGFVTDIELSADNLVLFFGGQPNTGPQWDNIVTASDGFLHKVILSGLTPSGTFTTITCTPGCQGYSGTLVGQFNNATGSAGACSNPYRCFVKLPYSSDIGFLCYMGYRKMGDDAANTTSNYVYSAIFIFNTSLAGNALWKTANGFLVSLNIDSNLLPTFSDISAKGIYLSGATVIGNDDVFLFDTGGAGGYTFGTYAALWGGGGSNKKFTTLVGDSGDILWGATTFTTSTITTSVQLANGITACTLSGLGVSGTDYHFLVLNKNIGEVGSYYKYSCTSAGSFAGAVTIFLKKADILITLLQQSVPVGGLVNTKKYYYKYALRYQYSQLSPLIQNVSPINVTPTSGTSVKITIQVIQSVFNTRVTAIDIYRAESATTSTVPTTNFKLVETVDILSQELFTTVTDAYGTWRVFELFDIGNYGPTYESESGIPETLPNNYMRYAISTQGNGYIFVGQCYNEEFKGNETANIIFRSKKNAPDTFDWSNDFLVLPIRPLALHFFRNMLFVFDYNAIYVIDPESFTLLAKLDNYGANEPNNIASNNEFMVFANNNNIYLHDGQNISIISRAINISQYSSIGGLTTVNHRGLMSTYTLSIAFFLKKNSICFCYTKASSATLCFIFHIPTKSLYYWEIVKTGSGTFSASSAGSKVMFSDYLGNIYLSALTGLARIATSGTRLSCTWISKQFNGAASRTYFGSGDVTVLKKFIRIILNAPYGGTIATKYYALNANTTINTAFTSGANITDFATKANSIWLKIVIGATEQLQGITLIFRRMIGLR